MSVFKLPSKHTWKFEQKSLKKFKKRSNEWNKDFLSEKKVLMFPMQ